MFFEDRLVPHIIDLDREKEIFPHFIFIKCSFRFILIRAFTTLVCGLIPVDLSHKNIETMSVDKQIDCTIVMYIDSSFQYF